MVGGNEEGTALGTRLIKGPHPGSPMGYNSEGDLYSIDRTRTEGPCFMLRVRHSVPDLFPAEKGGQSDAYAE